MRFENYTKERVDEKVSSTEINDALKNARVFIGAEFEFMVDELKDWDGGHGNSDLQSDYERANRAYDDFNREWREHERNEQDIYKRNSEAEERKNELEDDEIPDKEAEIETAEEEISELRDEITELENADDALEIDNTIINVIKSKIRSLENDIDGYRVELEKLNDEWSDADEEFRDTENERDEIEYPYPNWQYVDYMKMLYNDYGIGDNRDGVPEYFFEDGDIPEPPDPEYLGLGGNLGDEEAWIDAMEQISPSLFREFPLNQEPEIGGYHSNQQKKGDKFWTITHDGSISEEGGAELISPPMPLPEFLKVCPKIFAWINKVGSTTQATGFHVHMSIEGVGDLKDAIDPIKLMVMTDEGGIYKFFEGREFNSYVQSTKRTLSQRGIGPDDLYRLVSHKKLEGKFHAGHSDAISFANIEKGHIEFRHMGGYNYSKKWNEVKTTVGRHSHNLAIACDDNYGRQEYLMRISRIVNKIDNLKQQRYIFWMIAFQTQLKMLFDKFEVTLEERKMIYAIQKLVGKHINDVRKQIETSGGLPDKDIKMQFDNDSNFIRSADNYSRDKLTELIGKTKMLNMDRILTELVPYINKGKLGK